MSKGEDTKRRILELVAPLFNRHGFLSAPLSDIMAVTGMQKGGIYNHFSSKEDLALQAFDYAVGLVSQKLTAALEGKTNALERLQSILNVFRDYTDGEPMPGGCPLLNCAVESDDNHPALRKRARQTMDRWRETLRRIIDKGVERSELRRGLDALQVADVIIASLEGAVAMSNLYKNSEPMRRVVNHLNQYFETDLRR
jgi:AcrR family transcriptional regulator